MMLYKLSLSNVRRSIKDYAIYFFTLVLGVAIFYVFNAIESQTVFLNMTSSTREIITLLVDILNYLSIFVSFVLGFLIIYASSFLMKRRNKEFGIYMVLGMSKGKISRILFYETFFIGLISLVVGLGLGFILSQCMSLVVVNLFEADMAKFSFVFSMSAFIKTLIYFSIMYLIVMVFNTISISKCKLIDLIQSKRVTEQLKVKNIYVCFIIFILASIGLGYAYWLVTGDINSIGEEFVSLLKPIVIGTITTVLIFWSISGFLLRVFTLMKGYYYKGLNSFTLRQFASKINTTVLSTSVICLMLFVTICLLSSALSIRNSMNADLKKYTPVDFQFEYSMSIDGHLVKENDTLFDLLKNNGYDMSDIQESYDYQVYTQKDGNLTGITTLGPYYEAIHQQAPTVNFNNFERFMPLRVYNHIASMYGMKEYELKDNEYMIVADFAPMVEIRNSVLRKEVKINVLGHELSPKYDHCEDGFIELTSGAYEVGLIIIPDCIEINADDVYESNYVIGNYIGVTKDQRIKNEENVLAAIHQLHKDYSEQTNLEIYTGFNTKLEITEMSVGLGATVTFIALYLGIVFLISSAAILALQQLSESADNIERYAMIRKIGADEKMINTALFRQIGIFFLFPLLLALIHSYFGMEFAKKLIMVIGARFRLSSSFYSFIFVFIIYGGYFLLTYLCSKNMIKEKR